MPSAVEVPAAMTVLPDPVPLQNHRLYLQQYLRGIRFSPESVAGRIIEERLPERYALDPVRPALVLWACAAANGEIADALPVAAAFDLFDRFLLLHDELTDESAATIARWGLGQSLNAGDAFYALAFRTLASDVLHPDARLDAARLVGESVLKAIERSEDGGTRSAVLTGAAMRAGAVIANAPEPLVRAFARAGELLAQGPASQALAALPNEIRREDRDAFEEVVRYVARRTA